MADPAEVLAQTVNGLFYAAILFLMASGLNVIFGVLGILNLAHGSFYMVGAYIAYTVMIIALGSVGWGSFAAAAVAAAVVVAVLGVAVERGLLRPLYGKREELQLLLTFGLILIFDDLVKMIWGPQYLGFPRLPGGSFKVGAHEIPHFSIFAIIVGFAVAGLLHYFFNNTITGKRITAAAYDKDTAAALGINVDRLMVLTFALGSALAGLSGAVAGPLYSAQPGMGLEVIIHSFAVIVIGGMGSILGALVGSVIIGLSRSAMYILYPRLDIVLIYVIMILVLLFKPAGLFGRQEVVRR